jgi:hypothetical protein
VSAWINSFNLPADLVHNVSLEENKRKSGETVREKKKGEKHREERQ